MVGFTPISSEGQDGGSTILDRIQGLIASSLASLTKAVTNDAIVKVLFPTPAVDVQVFHGLGAVPKTIDIVGLNANSVVWESATNNNQRSQFVLMRVSAAPVTVIFRFS